MSVPQDEPAAMLAAFEQVEEWLDDLVDLLDDGMREIRRLLTAVAEDWPDARGREWCSQADHLHRGLEREWDLGLELSRAVGRMADEIGAAVAQAQAETRPGQPEGIRLGGTEGSRVGDRSGVWIATLPDPDAPAR
ncbi:hypothetical protein ACFQE5_00610 [Pseudonocardia hispaniensis]|uniref:WXG100 family type VII secretion target n=1 Tax=Pseudonocardia hispaniensis TaxID=904933 RepID=A0ABW1IW49_9PSEU